MLPPCQERPGFLCVTVSIRKPGRQRNRTLPVGDRAGGRAHGGAPPAAPFLRAAASRNARVFGAGEARSGRTRRTARRFATLDFSLTWDLAGCRLTIPFVRLGCRDRGRHVLRCLDCMMGTPDTDSPWYRDGLPF